MGQPQAAWWVEEPLFTPSTVNAMCASGEEWTGAGEAVRRIWGCTDQKTGRALPPSRGSNGENTTGNITRRCWRSGRKADWRTVRSVSATAEERFCPFPLNPRLNSESHAAQYVALNHLCVCVCVCVCVWDSVCVLFYAACVCVYWMWSRSLSFSRSLASRSARSRTPAPRRCSARPPAAWGYRGDGLWSAGRDRERETDFRQSHKPSWVFVGLCVGFVACYLGSRTTEAEPRTHRCTVFLATLILKQKCAICSFNGS